MVLEEVVTEQAAVDPGASEPGPIERLAQLDERRRRPITGAPPGGRSRGCEIARWAGTSAERHVGRHPGRCSSERSDFTVSRVWLS